MPSTLVHLGLAALIATALLSDHFDWRALVIVFAVVAFPEIDTFLGLWFDGAHRAYLHNLWVVLIPAILLAWDTRRRERSFVRERWGDWGVRVGWVSLVSLLFAHILLDAFFNGVNLFWPVHDSFYDLSGRLIFSTERGLVQTFIELDDPTASVRGTTADTHYRTGVDPTSPGEPAEEDVERIFPLADNGTLFVVMVSGYLVAAIRLVEVHVLDR